MDIITVRPVKDSPKEKVRQEVARQLIFEYQIAPESMQTDFRVSVDGKSRKVDIAIFEAGKPHELEFLRRVVVCRPEPKATKKAVVKLRDFKQADSDLKELRWIMEAGESCEWGLWTNALERFFLRREKKRFEYKFHPHGDWPMADGTMSTPDMHAETYVRPGEENSLRRAFQRCHNFIHGNEGMPKDAAFWQFLISSSPRCGTSVIIRVKSGSFSPWQRSHSTTMDVRSIRERITPLFEAVKKQYPKLFRPSDEITLSEPCSGLHGDGAAPV